MVEYTDDYDRTAAAAVPSLFLVCLIDKVKTITWVY